MRTIIIICCIIIGPCAKSQEKANIVEAGKILVELIRNLKPAQKKVQGCPKPNLADCCFKNNMTGRMKVTFQFKQDTASKPIAIFILPGSEECVLEIKAGIYTYKIENAEPVIAGVLRSGDIKLEACESAWVVLKPE